jgi:hypothetical protein
MANKKRRKPGAQPARTPVKSERKEEARRLRAELEKKAAQAARRRSRLIRLGAGLVVLAVVYGVLQLTRAKSPGTPPSTAPTSSPTVDPGILPGIQTGNEPWSAGNDPANLRARLSAIGLDALGAEGEVLHIHQHLDVFVNGKQVEVPAEIGIPPDGSFISPLHTHDTSGIMHVESPTQRAFTLGQFFDVWGVKLTSRCLGGYCNSGDATLAVYVNGHKITQDPALIVLASHQEIVVTYGTPSQLPNPIPSSFTFPVGL